MKAKSRTLFRYIGPLSLLALLATHCSVESGGPQGDEQGQGDQGANESVAEAQSALIQTTCAGTFTIPASVPSTTTVVPLGCPRTAPGFHRRPLVSGQLNPWTVNQTNLVNCIGLGYLNANPRDARVQVYVQGAPYLTGTCTVTVTEDSDCAHAPCTKGSALDPTCSPNVAAICARDGHCCTESWAQRCVDEVATFAEETC